MSASFQPFGDLFDIPSPLSPAQVKSAVQSRMKGWFDPKSGARGWIAGPFICLWLDTSKQHGPMLIGRISPHGVGARIRGTAGSNLPGLFLYSAALAFMLAYGLACILGGGPLFLPALWILLAPVMFWWSHKMRREAEPLVRFLRDAIPTGARSPRHKWAGVEIARPMTMRLNGKVAEGPVTTKAIYEALLSLAPESVLTLQSAPDSFIEAFFDEKGFDLAKRDEGHLASRQRPDTARPRFTFEEAVAAFMAYAADAPAPEGVVREPATS